MGLGPTDPAASTPGRAGTTEPWRRRPRRTDTPAEVRAAVLAVLSDPSALAPILMTDCPRCDGVGVIEHPGWAGWWADEKALRDAWELAHPGANWYASAEHAEHEASEPETDAEEIECPQCRGASTVPTAVGSVMLRFFRAHLH